MPEALQSLIDKLQGEVVQEADAKADAILEEASAEAKRRLAAANADAIRIRADAEREATLTRERGEQALRQAGRDLIIGVRRGIEDVLTALMRTSLDGALSPETLRDMLVTMATAYAERRGADQRMSVLLGEADREKLAKLFAGELRGKLAEGLELRVGADIDRGFRLVLEGDDIEHDFTLDAIASVLGEMLRPELARLLAPEAAAEDPA